MHQQFTSALTGVIVALLVASMGMHTMGHTARASDGSSVKLGFLPEGFRRGDIPIEVMTIGQTFASEVDFPLKIDNGNFQSYTTKWQEDRSVQTKRGLRIEGLIRTDSPVERVLYTVDNGQNWQQADGDRFWSFIIPKSTFEGNKELDIVIMAWTSDGVVAGPMNVGPLVYESFQPDGEPAEIAEPTQQFHPIRKKAFYIGGNVPGVSFGMQGDRLSGEIRVMFGDDILLWGPRLNYNFYPYRGGNFYWAFDVFRVEFEGDLTEGEGVMAGTTFGFQKFIGKYVSFTVDMGPYFILLRDNLSEEEVDGFEYVLNSGINFHF